MTYVEVDLLPDDPGGASAFLERAFRTCADEVPVKVGAVTVLVGLVLSDDGARTATTAAAFLTPGRVAWVVLDGRAWTTAERDHALDTIVAHLS